QVQELLARPQTPQHGEHGRTARRLAAAVDRGMQVFDLAELLEMSLAKGKTAAPASDSPALHQSVWIRLRSLSRKLLSFR
ncbi:MAG TPA: hypothetical protein VJA25_07850, partial [Dehalococcoidia bacterium]|nr:hypothetical protein [Dehalococcoidia bacterium]